MCAITIISDDNNVLTIVCEHRNLPKLSVRAVCTPTHPPTHAHTHTHTHISLLLQYIHTDFLYTKVVDAYYSQVDDAP